MRLVEPDLRRWVAGGIVDVGRVVEGGVIQLACPGHPVEGSQGRPWGFCSADGVFGVGVLARYLGIQLGAPVGLLSQLSDLLHGVAVLDGVINELGLQLLGVHAQPC